MIPVSRIKDWFSQADKFLVLAGFIVIIMNPFTFICSKSIYISVVLCIESLENLSSWEEDL